MKIPPPEIRQMAVLGLDTCGASGSIALGLISKDAVVIQAQQEMAGKTYSARLMPELRALLRRESFAPTLLTAIVVVNGPGSFTGIRIGVSSAKGLATALEIPLLAVSRLAVLAWKAGVESAALDAGRNEVYFRHGSRESLLSWGDIPAEGAIAVCEDRLLAAIPAARSIEAPTAADALSFAAASLLAGDFADTATLDGNYVRRADAEMLAKMAGRSE